MKMQIYAKLMKNMDTGYSEGLYTWLDIAETRHCLVSTTYFFYESVSPIIRYRIRIPNTEYRLPNTSYLCVFPDKFSSLLKEVIKPRITAELRPWCSISFNPEMVIPCGVVTLSISLSG